MYRHTVFLVGTLILLLGRMRLRWPRAVSFSFLIAIAVTGTQLYSMTHDNAVSELFYLLYVFLWPVLISFDDTAHGINVRLLPAAYPPI